MEHSTHPLSSSATQLLGATCPTSNLLHSLMAYKQWADAELTKVALASAPLLGASPEAGYVAAIIRHYHTVDCIFRAHLLGIPHGYISPNPPEPATLAELERHVSEVDAWYVDYTHTIHGRELGQALQVTFTDGQEQVLTRSDILLHVALHGAGHRAQVSLLLQKCGAAAPPDRFTNYLRRGGD